MNKLRILFVDDDPNILSGLKRMLHRNRHQWDLDYAEGGRVALAVLHHCPADVVISDMRMPEMDGPELLGQVKMAFPQTIRGVLSGQAEKDQTLRVIGTTHFYLSKPCQPGELRRTLAKIDRAVAWLPDAELRGRVLQLKAVPSHPLMLESVRNELTKEPIDFEKVSNLAASDMGLTAKILQLVCTPLFGKSREDCDARMAVSILGERLLSDLLQADGQTDAFGDGEPAFSLNSFFRHSRSIADLARKIAERETDLIELQMASFNAGWLRGIGQLVLSAVQPQKYRRVILQLANGNESLSRAEHDCFGCTHANVGGFLLGVWGLPDSVCDAVGTYLNQLDPRAGGEPFSATTAVQAATILAIDHADATEPWARVMDPGFIASWKARHADKYKEWSLLAAN